MKYLPYLLIALAIQGYRHGNSTGNPGSRGPLNILWLVAEDLGPYIPSFGDSTVHTANLSRLAAEGVRYTRVFSVSGVCAPSRAAIATGMYPTSIGAHHMRTLYQQPAALEKGIINYECVPPAGVRMVSEIMREHGYYCTNNAKEDYQFHPSPMAWDESSVYAHWRNRPADRPFYAVFNFGVTHESNLWNPFGRPYDLDTFPPPRNEKKWWEQFEGVDKPLYVDPDLPVEVPPYLPDNKIVRNDIRRMYSNIVEMDRHAGVVLEQLEEDGLLENTIIVWYSDHGGPLPRQKRLLYDSGLKVPMIIRYPGQWRAGEKDERLISFVDFAPTLLSMAGIEPPSWMQGVAFEGDFRAERDREYVHASADRFDEHDDMIRAVRDKRIKYLRNFVPEKGYYLPLEYRERMASMQELLRLRDEDRLNDVQMQWFRTSKPGEELFDTQNDPYELNDLAEDPAYSGKLEELRKECQEWMAETLDRGFIPEKELIRMFWPGMVRPKTATPEVLLQDGRVTISCATEGASIGYKYPRDDKPWLGWRIYEGALEVPEGKKISIIAHRIGFAASDTVQIERTDRPVIQPCGNSGMESGDARPNILLLLADDLGYGELGSYGQKIIQTPELDRLAEQGLRFTDFYAGNTVCSPSRAVLLTGKSPDKVSIRGNAAYLGNDRWEGIALDKDEFTLGEMLKGAGYQTAFIGKWHLDDPDDVATWATGHGFEYAVQEQWTARFDPVREFPPNRLWINGDQDFVPYDYLEYDCKDELRTDMAFEFLRRMDPEKPFFLFMSYRAPHSFEGPIRDTLLYAGQGWPEIERVHAAKITLLDRQIGRLLSRLEEMDELDQTLVLFTSDNGPHFAPGGHDLEFFDSNGDLKGGKRDLYEGGVRVPLLVCWKNKVRKGSLTDHVSGFQDIMPTLAEVAGTEVPEKSDGISFLPLLLGNVPERHEILTWEFQLSGWFQNLPDGGFRQSARMGNWKAVRYGIDSETELYDLQEDISESKDLAGRHPDIVERMNRLFESSRTETRGFPFGGVVQNHKSQNRYAGD